MPVELRPPPLAGLVDKAEKTRGALSAAPLLKAAPRDRALAYLFLICTGLRCAEAAKIRWGYAHLNAMGLEGQVGPGIVGPDRLAARRALDRGGPIEGTRR